MKNKLRMAIAFLLCAMVLCACGKSQEPLGVDSITVLGTPPSEAPEADAAETVFAECGGKSYSASLYRLLLYRALCGFSEEYGLPMEDIAAEKVLFDGEVMPAEEAAARQAIREFERICLVDTLVTENSIDIAAADSYLRSAESAKEDYLLHGETYRKLGVDLEDIVTASSEGLLSDTVFCSLYGPGGEQEIPLGDLEEIMASRMRRIQYTYLPFYDDESFADYSPAKIKELKKLSAEYLKRYKAGEAFSDILRENYLLLDGYGLFFDPDCSDIYYSVYSSDMAEEIALQTEKLKDNEAAVVNAEFYSAVVLRLPVNGNEDALWFQTALQEAYYSSYGKEFEEMLSDRQSGLEIDYSPKLETAEELLSLLFD